MSKRDDADREVSVLEETTAVADAVVALLTARDRRAEIQRKLVADVMWDLEVRVPGLRDSWVLIEDFDHVISPTVGFRGAREREGPGVTTAERAQWIVEEIYARRA